MFNIIRYNTETGLFDFNFNYSNFTDKVEDSRNLWTVSSYGHRIGWILDGEQKVYRSVDLTEEFKALFTAYGIDYTGNLKEAISSINKRSFYEKLVCLFNLMVQMCNINSKEEVDYLVSPVADETGHYFLSSKGQVHLPVDTDANAAYNIARKGKLMIQRVTDTPANEKVALGISNAIWFKYIQNVK